MLPGKTGHLQSCFSETISRCELLPPTTYTRTAASSRQNHDRRAHDALTISHARQRCGSSQDLLLPVTHPCYSKARVSRTVSRAARRAGNAVATAEPTVMTASQTAKADGEIISGSDTRKDS